MVLAARACGFGLSGGRRRRAALSRKAGRESAAYRVGCRHGSALLPPPSLPPWHEQRTVLGFTRARSALNAQPKSARPEATQTVPAARRYWNRGQQRYCRSLVRYCSTLRVSADRAANRAAHTRAKPAVLDLQRPGLCETRTLRWRELDSNLRFRARAGSILPVRGRLFPGGGRTGPSRAALSITRKVPEVLAR